MKARAGDACFRISLEEVNLDKKFDLVTNMKEAEFEIEQEEEVPSPIISIKEYEPKPMASVHIFIDSGYNEKAKKSIEAIKNLLSPKDGNILVTEVGDTTTPEGWSTYVKEIVPTFGQPKLVITFGMFSTVPFFKKQSKENIRWFDVTHTRLHEKSMGEHKFLLFVFPALDTCLDPEFKSLMNNQLKMVKGLITGMGL